MTLLRYIEIKSGYGDRGPAWIGRVVLSRTKTTVYFNGRAFRKSYGQGISANYFEVETGEEVWISGIKKNGRDRRGGGGFIDNRTLRLAYGANGTRHPHDGGTTEIYSIYTSLVQ